MIPRHLQHTNMLNTSHSGVRPHRKTVYLDDPGRICTGLHRDVGPDTETIRTAVTDWQPTRELTRSPPKRKTRNLEFRHGKCSRAWLWERAAAQGELSGAVIGKSCKPTPGIPVPPLPHPGCPSRSLLPAPLPLVSPVYLPRSVLSRSCPFWTSTESLAEKAGVKAPRAGR